MHVLVAGGTGFIGRHVAAELEERGHRVTVLSRRSPAPLRGDAVVNLVGIKREDGDQTFERVHVDFLRSLLASGIRRIVHVSVVCARPDSSSPYHDTKWRAEEILRASGLDWTILRPGVVWGRGDDLVTHLVKMVRASAVFPVVGWGTSLLQPVDVRDVAEAVAAALERPAAIGRTYDLVGPERLALRDVVRRVTDACSLPLWILPTPVWVQRLAITAVPLASPAQLRMLVDGLVGDPDPARRELGIEPRPFTRDAVAELAGPIEPPASARLVSHRLQADDLRTRRGAFAAALVFALPALVMIELLMSIPNLWHRMAVNHLLLVPAALLAVPVGWRALLRPRFAHIAVGLCAAAILTAGTWAVLALAPSLAAATAPLRAWAGLLSLPATIALLVFIVAGEEIVWRGAIGLPLAARLGPWAGSAFAAIAFAAAHLPLRMPVLVLAALGAGFFWSLLAVKTRTLVVPFVCHLAWDAALLWGPVVSR